ncbi:kynurenine 3-monooxygenase [Malassezia yamatoensis]|uniref:Kynurenine 3-monooxygenase n=1 Tax=Malassezia yamatoensis TaxID=253288 RepID=A0AAJ5YV98_9BASI|nr:kynurenine 3-monooxygenase [Malassezia yamatoensis]
MVRNSVAVIGAGPVGCLAAIGFARRGYEVSLYEARSECSFREESATKQRSINLALSVRGITALRVVGGDKDDHSKQACLVDEVLSEVVPMSARMIHTNTDVGVRLDRQEYSSQGESIYSFERAKLNWLLLNSAANYSNIEMYFQHTLMQVQPTSNESEVHLAFQVPGHADWASVFEQHMSQRESAQKFFQTNFPDAFQIMDQEELLQTLISRTPSSLGSVRCTPMHAGSLAVFLGDSAHAMVPFYGQGLNCGLEDVRVFFEEWDKATSEHHSMVQAKQIALPAYTAQRSQDVAAIQVLAQENYKEMRSKVVSRTHKLRKWVDTKLAQTLPANRWHSLYEMVTFSNMGYAKALETERRQQRILRNLGSAMGLGLLWTLSWGVYRISTEFAK